MARFETPESILAHKGSPEELKEAEEALYKIIVPANKEQAINIDDFAGLYEASAIKADKEYVQRVSERIRREEETDETKRAGAMRGELFEAIVNSQIAESDWMGGNADVIVPSHYDDLKNKVDSIVEFTSDEGGNAHLALGIDVTESDKNMREKFQQIRASIEKGDLSRVKYFKSKNIRAELSNVPRVVVGTGRGMVESISDLLLRFKRLQKSIGEGRKNQEDASAGKRASAEFSRIRNEIAQHPMQAVILVEIRQQLQAFADYARRIGKDDVAELYAPVLAMIDGVIEEKGAFAKLDLASEEDPIYQMIRERTDRFAEELDRPN